MIRQKKEKGSKILAIVLALVLLFGCLLMLNFDKPSYANELPDKPNCNMVYYYTDSMDPTLDQTALGNYDGYMIKYYAPTVWHMILQNPTIYQLKNSNGTILDSDGYQEYYDDCGCIYIIELRNTVADGNDLNRLFGVLKNDGHRVMFISAFSLEYYSRPDTEPFDFNVDEFVFIGNLKGLIGTILADIIYRHGELENISLLVAMEFFDGYSPSMDLDTLYADYPFFKELIDQLLFHFDEVLDTDHTVEDFLASHGIKIYLYDELGDIYDIADGATVSIDNYTIDSSYAEGNPFYAISVNTMSDSFYDFLKGYQNYLRLLFDTIDDSVNRLRIYVNGEMPYAPDGLICETIGEENCLNTDNKEDASVALNRLKG